MRVIITGDLRHIERAAKLVRDDGQRVYEQARVGYGWGFRSLDGMSFFVKRTKTGLSVEVSERPEAAASAALEPDCHRCGTPLVTGPRGFTDCPACNPDPARG